MGDYQPRYTGHAHKVTRPITGTVTGGRIVTVAGVHAVDGSSDFYGVASRDAVAGDRIVLHTGEVQRVVATGAIAAGANVKCAAAGQVAAWVLGTDNPALIYGKAMEAAAGAGSELDVKPVF